MKFKDITIGHLWMLAVLGVCFSYLCTQPIDQYDFWQHLKVGEIIFNTKKILDKDIFTFTIYGKPYIDMHWGAQLFYWVLYKLGGLNLIVFSHALMLLLSYTLIFRVSLNQSNDLRISSIATLISILVSLSNFALRPQAFSILFFCTAFYLLNTKKFIYIPFIFLLWANFHGAFLVGLILLITYSIEKIDSEKKYIINHEVVSTIIMCIIFTLINPFKLDLYTTAFNVGPASSQFTHIVEWGPPSLQNETGIIFFSALFLLLALSIWKRLPWTMTEIFSFLVFSILAFKWQRAVIWWGIISVPIFTKHLKEVLSSSNNKPSTKTESIINSTFAIVLIAYLVSTLPWLKTDNPLVPPVKRSLIALNTPIKLTEELKTIESAKRIFNNFSWGSYFEWALRSDQKIFFDPKDFLYSPAFISDFYKINNGESDFENILLKYKIDTLAIGKEEQNTLCEKIKQSKNWEKVYEDKLGYIFISKSDRFLINDKK